MLINEILDYIEELAPKKLAHHDKESNIILFGEGQRQVKGAGVTWMATTRVINDAIKRGINLLIVHEALFYEGQYPDRRELVKEVDERRKRLLVEGGITVYRIHLPWDVRDTYGVVDSFIGFLQLSQESISGEAVKVCHLGESLTVEELCQKVLKRMKLSGLRVSGDLKRNVRHIGIAVGGFGLWAPRIKELVQLGAEVIIAGETQEYTQRFAEEYGVGIIETIHSESENIGLRQLAGLLRKKFPEEKIEFLNTGKPFLAVIQK